LIDALLFVSLFLAVSKTLRIEQLEEEYENDYQLLKCLNGIYLIVLVLFVLIKAN